MKDLSCEKMKAYLEDENKGSQNYKNDGINHLARDESGHAKFWEEKLKKKGCK
jgi:hypothetical protein